MAKIYIRFNKKCLSEPNKEVFDFHDARNKFLFRINREDFRDIFPDIYDLFAKDEEEWFVSSGKRPDVFLLHISNEQNKDIREYIGFKDNWIDSFLPKIYIEFWRQRLDPHSKYWIGNNPELKKDYTEHAIEEAKHFSKEFYKYLKEQSRD